MNKKRLALLAAPLAGLVLASGALADDYGFAPTKAGITGSLSPATVGTPKHPKIARLNVTTTLTATPATAIPATVDTVTVWFPHGAVANGRLFPSCNAHKLDLVRGDRRACPKGSRIGHASTLGYYADLKEPIHVDLYNTKRGKAVLFYFFGDNPVIIRQPVVAPLVKLPARSQYGYKLSLKLPDTLQDPVPGTWASFRTFSASVHATRRVKHKLRGYIEDFYCPIGGAAGVRIDYRFLDGQTATAKSYIKCKRGHTARPRHGRR